MFGRTKEQIVHRFATMYQIEISIKAYNKYALEWMVFVKIFFAFQDYIVGTNIFQ